ncbi:MAG: hypothetical protein WBF58_00945 [Xanthobacteraceae bacterium]
MAICNFCNKNFRLFGLYQNGYSFCSAKCRDNARAMLKKLDALPPQEIDGYIERVRAQPCPKCGGPGPLDLYRSYRVYSVIVFTSWSTHSHFTCRACARKEQLKSLGFSALLGWWGIPFGLIATPIQIARDIGALAGWPDPARASPRLQSLLKLNLARQIAAQAATGAAAAS